MENTIREIRKWSWTTRIAFMMMGFMPIFTAALIWTGDMTPHNAGLYSLMCVLIGFATLCADQLKGVDV